MKSYTCSCCRAEKIVQEVASDIIAYVSFNDYLPYDSDEHDDILKLLCYLGFNKDVHPDCLGCTVEEMEHFICFHGDKSYFLQNLDRLVKSGILINIINSTKQTSYLLGMDAGKIDILRDVFPQIRAKEKPVILRDIINECVEVFEGDE
jgi:hypothetical protein